MKNEILKSYTAKRLADPYLPARIAIQWARSELKPRMLESLPGVGKPETLQFGDGYEIECSLDYDEGYDLFDMGGVKAKWLRDEYGDSKRLHHRGALIEDDGKVEWYSLDHWDHRSCLCVGLRRSDGATRDGRRGYWHGNGCSRSVADDLARKSVQKECDYWARVAQGDYSAYCISVTLLDAFGVEVDSESCCGYECSWNREESEYMLSEMNGRIDRMVVAAKKHEQELDAVMAGL